MIDIENGFLKISIDEIGGELKSIFCKVNKKEYMWEGNPEFWASQSPILFPIVGKLKDDKYSYKGIMYPLTQHGFARRNNFKVESLEKEKVVFRLDSDEETLKIYPFQFSLFVIYKLVLNRIEVEYVVQNLDNKNMYFSIGAHPGFALHSGNIEDYTITFSPNKKSIKSYYSQTNTGLLIEKERIYETPINLNNKIFDNGALIFNGIDVHTISLLNKNTRDGIVMNCPGFEYVAIWTKPNANFVCLEPWFGLGDFEDKSLDLKHKKGIKKLEEGKNFKCSFSLEVVYF